MSVERYHVEQALRRYLEIFTAMMEKPPASVAFAQFQAMETALKEIWPEADFLTDVEIERQRNIGRSQAIKYLQMYLRDPESLLEHIGAYGE